ncbi:Carboxylesterase family [Geosmithia morbida]|uniref:Carboxylesterase family n=1 Tax=Geosmithia morbida TaxID=1094350 RepID=A0A9P4YVS5_9HYPO|nr:Carboxylesterase family [Geosmithia morbida]KAF4123750.1 Carboxylesterase family [Geosmithia morbida]
MVSTKEAHPAVTVAVRGSTRPIVGRTQAASAGYPKSLDLFHGIRYARAPLWEKSQPVRLGEPVSPTARGGDGNGAGEYDDLCVYITRPSRNAESEEERRGGGGKMPVVVFFHGGAFNFGHALDSDLKSFVARSRRDIISVSVGYRLGPVGFGPGRDERREGSESEESISEGGGERNEETGLGKLNLGLDDQMVGLEWVRQWIGAFGGDGEDITVMGIGHHMLRQPSQRIFRRVILESGSPTARSVLSARHPRTARQYQEFRERVRALGGVNRSNITRAGDAVWAQGERSLQWPFQPVVDDDHHDSSDSDADADSMIPDTPLHLWDRPGFVPPPILTGFCSHEGITFIPPDVTATLREFFGALIPGLDLDALDGLYPPGMYPSERLRIVDAYSHHAYICPAFHTAHKASLLGRRRPHPVYLYEFAAPNTPNGFVSHCAHGPVLRPPGGVPLGPGLADVGREMMARWERFILSGDGDGDGDGTVGRDDVWPTFKTPFAEDGRDGGDETAGLLLVFGQGNDEARGGTSPGVPVRTRRMTGREMDVCRFWWDNMPLSQGMGR